MMFPAINFKPCFEILLNNNFIILIGTERTFYLFKFN